MTKTYFCSHQPQCHSSATLTSGYVGGSNPGHGVRPNNNYIS